jgi:hypothetical protein
MKPLGSRSPLIILTALSLEHILKLAGKREDLELRAVENSPEVETTMET